MTRKLPYRRGVGIVLFNNQGQVFTGQRLDNPGPAWQMPQGGIDEGEAPLDAALRELHEETGIEKQWVEYLAKSGTWLRYDLPEDLIPSLWNGQFCGQEQLWFAFRFLGSDKDINIKTIHPEFSQWKWSDFHSISGAIVPFKKSLYDQLITEFQYIVKDRK